VGAERFLAEIMTCDILLSRGEPLEVD